MRVFLLYADTSQGMFEKRDQEVQQAFLQAHPELQVTTLRPACDLAKQEEKSLAEALVACGLASREKLLQAIARALGLSCWLGPLPADASLRRVIPPDQAIQAGVAPLRQRGTVVELVSHDPFDSQTALQLEILTGRKIQLVVADPSEICVLQEQLYGRHTILSRELAGAGPDDLAKDSIPPDSTERRWRTRLTPVDKSSVATSHNTDSEDDKRIFEDLVFDLINFDEDQELFNDPNEPKLLFSDEFNYSGNSEDSGSATHQLDYIIRRAFQEGASDVHFERLGETFNIRARVAGMMKVWGQYDKALGRMVISRLKALSGINIAEQRLPQDGRLTAVVDRQRVDFRVSVLPVNSGESAVIRLLDTSTQPLALDNLGLPAPILDELRRLASLGHGMLVASGPTGSGKTTTICSLINSLSTGKRKILTIEDPVEYHLPQATQVAVHEDVGLTFEVALRAFLRHDPDVILAGEIRDPVSAAIAVQASLTGHLVLTTLHTRDAIATINRLIDMGVDRFLLADCLIAVLNQRLLRRLCLHCRKQILCDSEEDLNRLPQAFRGMLATSSKEAHQDIDQPHNINSMPLMAWAPGGCPACGGTGYTGRFALAELFAVTGEVREAINTEASSGVLAQMARETGMIPLAEVACGLLANGQTSLDEIGRIFA